MLPFSMPGKVTRVSVDVGDVVQAGDVLVQIESDVLQNAVRNAERNTGRTGQPVHKRG